MRRVVTLAAAGIAAVAVVAATAASVPTATAAQQAAPVEGLSGPRGLDIGRHGFTVVGEDTGKISQAFRFGPKAGTTKKIGKVPGGFGPSVAVSPDGIVWALQGPWLYMWDRSGNRHKVANISAWVQDHPDPFDQEDNPTDSNPFNVSATRNRAVLVADAAANAVLRVRRNGHIKLIARVKPRTVRVPANLPDFGEEGPPVPPAGTKVKSEAVTTSVAMGPGGAIYIGELRGFPGNPGKSQVWRVRPGAHHVVCKPHKPRQGACKRYADGLTSIVDLDVSRHGTVYAAELSKMSWLFIESDPPTPGAEVGAVIRIARNRSLHELSPVGGGPVVLPGNVAVAPKGGVWVTGPIFGQGGSIYRVH